jgi:Bacterial extracellular solute-binding proteins, family 5 Middle
MTRCERLHACRPGRGAKKQVKAVEIVNPYHVRFHLHAPWPDFLIFYASPTTGAAWIVPKKYTEKVGTEEFKNQPIGLGPYRLVSHQPGVEAAPPMATPPPASRPSPTARGRIRGSKTPNSMSGTSSSPASVTTRNGRRCCTPSSRNCTTTSASSRSGSLASCVHRDRGWRCRAWAGSRCSPTPALMKTYS